MPPAAVPFYHRRRPRLTASAMARWFLALTLCLGIVPIAFAGQTSPTADWTAGAPVSTADLGSGPYAEMQMLLEKTFFKVDVLHLRLRFDPPTTARIQQLADGREYSSGLAGQLADVALGADTLLVRSRFLRDITLDQFLDGMRDNLADAQEGGFLTDAERREIIAQVEVAYEPLRATGIRAGESIWYRVWSDELHVAYERTDGSLAIDARMPGTQHRRAVLGGYLSPDSEFRGGLIRSLFERATD